MNNKKYDLLGIGNAIVDILAYKDNAFLAKNNLPEGSMALIDEAKSDELYKAMGAATECSGGSAANTLAGFAMLGGSAAFIGKTKNDQFGKIFRKSLNKVGVSFDTPASNDGEPTARCLVFVTEKDAQFGNPPKVERTMATFLGAAGKIFEDDINEEVANNSSIVFFEGYLWDNDNARAAIRKAIDIVHSNGGKVAFTLSDTLCVGRHKDDFLKLVENDVDILFANEHEIEALCGSNDIRTVCNYANGKCETICVTRSEKGSYVISNGKIYTIEAEKVDNVYDVTGAGDLYAAGFLYGYVNELGLQKSGELGSKCAAEVIKYIGARPVTDLKDLL